MRVQLERATTQQLECGRCEWGECHHLREVEVAYTVTAEVTDQGEGREADIHILSVEGLEHPLSLGDLDEQEVKEALWFEYVRLEEEEAQRLEDALKVIRRRYLFLKKLGDKGRCAQLVAQAEKAGIYE